MEKRVKYAMSCFLILSGLVPVALSWPVCKSKAATVSSQDTAALVGGFGGDTTGGSQATANQRIQVTNRQELLAALGKSQNTTPKVIYVSGTIDMNTDATGHKITAAEYAQGTGYQLATYLKTYDPKVLGKKEPSGKQEAARLAAQKKQAAQIEVHIPSNTTIIGEKGAVIAGGSFIIEGENVIIRQLTFQAPYDEFPQWDPKDGTSGNWNSQYDALSIKGAKKVWLDHNTFEDGPHLDQVKATEFGREYQHHDGLTDITNGADQVTISNNRYQNHDKTILIGSSDKKTSDRGKLHVTLVGNLFENTVQRTARVRYGQVQFVNNLYRNPDSTHYSFHYAWGLGKEAQIDAQGNVFDLPKVAAKKLVKRFGGKELVDRDTLMNGQHIDLAKLMGTRAVNWTPPKVTQVLASTQVADFVSQHAGAEH